MFSRIDSAATMPLLLAILRAIRDAVADRVVRRREPRARAVDLDRAGVGALRGERQLRGFGAPEPSSPASPTISPGRTSRSSGHHPAPADLLHRQERVGLAGGAFDRRRTRLQRVGHPFAAGHLRDQHVDRQVARQILAFALAVAHHGDPVGHRVGLLEKVRDEQDRDARCLQPAQHVEQPRDLAVVEARRRLVENQHARVDRHRPCDRDHLLHGDRIRVERARDVERVEFGQRRARRA